MGKAHTMIGHSLCMVTDRCHPGVRMYDLPTVLDRAGYQKHRRTCELPYPCKCKPNPEIIEKKR